MFYTKNGGAALDGALSTIRVNGSEYQIGKDASALEGGIMKLYSELGTSTDGTMTQAAIKAAVEAAGADSKTEVAKAAGEQYLTLSEATALDGHKTYTLGTTGIDQAISDAIDAVVDGADTAFDTLKEISDWILSDESGAAAMVNRIAALESGKKDKQTAYTAAGMATDKTVASLTQNANGEVDITFQAIQDASASQHGLMSAAHYSKVEAIEAGAQVNVIEGVSINGAAGTITNKIVNLGSNFVQDASYVHTDNNYTTAEKNKLAAISMSVEGNALVLVSQAA